MLGGGMILIPGSSAIILAGIGSEERSNPVDERSHGGKKDDDKGCGAS
jgi:hypothetical protein